MTRCFPCQLMIMIQKLREHRYRKQLASICRHQEGRIAITGCGRSGTTYTSKLFNASGHRVGHETLEKHGICSWCLVPDTPDRCWGPSPKDLAKLELPYVHQVRHPLEVIASLVTFESRSWRFIEKFIPFENDDSLTERCMKYWTCWNRWAEKRAILTYRIEDIKNVLPQLFMIGGFDESRFDATVFQGLHTNVNRREHGRITWRSLKEENPQLTEQTREQAWSYGYDV